MNFGLIRFHLFAFARCEETLKHEVFQPIMGAVSKHAVPQPIIVRITP